MATLLLGVRRHTGLTHGQGDLALRRERQIALTSKLKTMVRGLGQYGVDGRTPLFHVTILATLCIRGL